VDQLNRQLRQPDQILLFDAEDESGISYPIDSHFFAGGEPHVVVNPEYVEGRYVWLDARITTAAGFIKLMATLDAVKGSRPKKLGLFLPYVPGARQDRRERGTAFTSKVYADILKTVKTDALIIFDPHSYVTQTLLPGAFVLHPHDVFDNTNHRRSSIYETIQECYDGLICPDSGAEKRVNLFAEKIGIKSITYGRKKRDVATGKLSGFAIDMLPVSGRYLMFDDIGDGCGTFIGLAEEIRRTHPRFSNLKLDLWLSHGIFSKGFDKLMENFEHVLTTNSFVFDVPVVYEERIHVRDFYWPVITRMKKLLGI